MHKHLQSTVITVKKDRLEKHALDALALKQAIGKDESQITLLDNLVDLIAEKLDNEKVKALFIL